jgi:hypothetical protein
MREIVASFGKPAGDKSHDHFGKGRLPVSPTRGPADLSTQATADIVDIYSRRLRELGDPEFITRWAALRYSLFFIAKDHPEYPDIKRQYETAAVEFRRRINGGLAIARPNHRKE